MAKQLESAVKVFVVTLAVATGAAFLFQAAGLTALGSFSVAGAFIGSVSTAALAALSAVTTLVGGLMSKGTDATAENFGTKVASRSPVAPRGIIYGKARTGGTITHIETSGTDSYLLSFIVALAGHEVESLEEVLVNDVKLNTTSSGGFEYATNSAFVNTENENNFGSGRLLRYVFLDGSQTTSNSTITSVTSLGSTDKFIGVSYMLMQLVFDSEKFGGGIPPLSFVIKGKKVYDPRTSTTAWSDNPALCVRDYITDTTYGLKATSDEVLDTTALGGFSSAANTCETGNTITTATVDGAVSNSTSVTIDNASTNTLIDVGQTVTGTGISGTVTVIKRLGRVLTLSSAQSISDGVTLTFSEVLYSANGITNMAADGTGVIEGLLSACAGKLSYINGKFVMFAGASVTPDMTITDDNLLAPISISTKNTSGETFNTVKAVYVDANNNYVATDSPVYTDSTLLSEDTPSGESSANYRKTLEIQLPFTDTSTMAQRLQRTALLHLREEVSLSVLCNIAFMQLQPFDWVYLTNERLGYTNKTFEVLSTNLEVMESDDVPILATRLSLKEINASVYAFASNSYTNPIDEGTSVSTGSFSVTAPTNLSVQATLVNTGYDLQVEWTNNPDDLIQGTEILYGRSSGTYISSSIAGKGKTKEVIPNVKPNSVYYIVARHFSSNNVYSDNTSEININTNNGLGVATPTAPSSLTATTTEPLSIGLSWTNPSNTDTRDIKIYRDTSSGFTPDDSTNLVRTIAAVPSLTQKVSFGVDDGLSPNTNYYFKVKADSFFSVSSSDSNQATGKFIQVDSANIGDDSITTDKIANDAVTTAKIIDDAVTNALIATDAVNQDSIAANSVTASEIVANTITASEIAANTITASQIASSTITATQIAANTITTSQIASNTIVAGNIAANTITASQIASNTITATQMAADSITATEIASSTIVAGNIATGTLTSASGVFGTISADDVTTGTLNANNVTVTNLNADNITTGTLSADNIQIDDVTIDSDGSGNLIIKSGGVDTTQIADSAITDAKVNDLSATKLTAGTIDADVITVTNFTADNINGDIDKLEPVSLTPNQSIGTSFTTLAVITLPAPDLTTTGNGHTPFFSLVLSASLTGGGQQMDVECVLLGTPIGGTSTFYTAAESGQDHNFSSGNISQAISGSFNAKVGSATTLYVKAKKSGGTIVVDRIQGIYAGLRGG